MWEQIILAIFGVSAGFGVAAGLFSFIISLGVVSDFADRTHTGEHILTYENSVALGGMIGNILFVYHMYPNFRWLIPFFGLFSGIFVGCWAMALAEILNVFPIFMRKTKVLRYISYIIIAMALGKGIGAWIFFVKGW